MRINLEKSAINPVGAVEDSNMLAQELGCCVNNLPTTYLGLPLGAWHKARAVWAGGEEKFH